MTQQTVEMVRIDNFIRFSSLYVEVHTRVRGTEPFGTGIRRAFNRYNKVAKLDGIKEYPATTLTESFEKEMTNA